MRGAGLTGWEYEEGIPFCRGEEWEEEVRRKPTDQVDDVYKMDRHAGGLDVLVVRRAVDELGHLVEAELWRSAGCIVEVVGSCVWQISASAIRIRI